MREASQKWQKDCGIICLFAFSSSKRVIRRWQLPFDPSSSFYEFEECAWCQGTGEVNARTCVACAGNKQMLVFQPSTRCTPCRGSGRANSPTDSRLYPRCDICGGTGWVRSLKPWEK